MSGVLYRAWLRMAHSFNRVGNAPRLGIQPEGRCERGPLGTRLNKSKRTHLCSVRRFALIRVHSR